jgi:hypothetical protein
MAPPRNLIFWGAGATKALGLRTTMEQQEFISSITGADDKDKSLEARVDRALGSNLPKQWKAAVTDLIAILGDGDEAYESISAIDDAHVEAMRRNWNPEATEKQLCERIIGLRLVYDWPALKSAVRLCPGTETGKFRLNDLFNLLDMHIPPGSGFRAPVPGGSQGPRDVRFLDVRRLIGAKNALLMILIAMFYIDWQVCLESRRDQLSKYYDFATLLGKRMQAQAQELAHHHSFDQPDFYRGDVSFVSLNYDPIALWVGFIANRDLNRSSTVPHIGSPAVPLQVFHDFGHMIPARRIGKQAASAWYPMNGAAAQRLNENAGSNQKIRLIKFLFPHGCLCWRECPDCGKLSAYHGDQWDRFAHGLIPPPPLKAFDVTPCSPWIPQDECAARMQGRVDARRCLHCDTLTFTHHTQVVMQSSFKPRPPSFIEEIDRDLRATTMAANHIIFMGYSLPLDDVTYRAFFSARRQGEVRCTVVDKDVDNPDWYGPAELKTRPLRETSPARAAQDIFGADHVRLYGGGVPGVFLDKGTATNARLEQLLTWST